MLNRVSVGIVVAFAFAPPLVAEDAKPDVKTKLEAHRGGVTALAFAPDGATVATGSGNGVVRLWDAKSGEEQVKLDPVGGTRVVHVGFSADGKLFSAAARRSVIAWSLAEPKKPKELFTDQYQEDRYKFGGVSGDGRRVYYYEATNNGVTFNLRYYDAKDQATASTDLKSQSFAPLAFATIPDTESALAVVLGRDPDKPDGVLTFVGLGDRWQLTDGLKKPDAHPNSVGFSPDGKWLAVLCGGSAHVWKVPGSQKVSGKPRAVVPGTAAAAGPNNLLAVAEKVEGKTRVYLYDLAESEPKIRSAFATEIEDVSCLAFAPDGKTLAVGDNVEGVVQLWALKGK
jgi:WD40 repeat protein